MNSKNITRGSIIMVNLPRNNNNSVQAGSRPCLVVSNNKGNQFSPVLIVVPLTSRVKKEMPTHLEINPSTKNGLTKVSIALCEQIITIGKDMVTGILGDIENTDLLDLKLKKSLALF